MIGVISKLLVLTVGKKGKMRKLWPEPQKLGIEKECENINNKDGFNEFVGNPKNWQKVLQDDFLYNSWVLPNAILLFGKKWFDNKKWKTRRSRGLPFVIINDEQRKEAKKTGINIDELPVCRSIISKIIETTSKSLTKYLKGEWYDGQNIKPPGAYITESIKNEIFRDVGAEQGYKPKVMVACPGCLLSNKKVALVYEGLGYYSCSVCKNKLKNLEMLVRSLNSCQEKIKFESEIEKIKRFVYFKPDENENLPTMHVWSKPDELVLDNEETKLNLVADQDNIDDEIFNKERIDILLEEIIINMSLLNTNIFSGFISWCFYLAVAKWMMSHTSDAAPYFFDWVKYEGSTKDITKVIRGQGGSIHQTIFYKWLDILEKNMDIVSQLKPTIKHLEDFKWFCRPPKFTGGPVSVFKAIISSKMSIPNNSNIVSNKSKFMPRLAKILSISAHNKDYVDDIRLLRWNSIHVCNDSNLVPGDIVEIKAIMMPGHCTHAPIQRILRLRSEVLKDIINRIITEDKTNIRNHEFWKRRKEIFMKAESIVKEIEDVRRTK